MNAAPPGTAQTQHQDGATAAAQTNQQGPQQPQQQQMVQMPHHQAAGGPTGAAPNQQELSVPALLDRLTHLEQYKTCLEQENRQMHQQLQVLSGFLNVVNASCRTTEQMLIHAAMNQGDPQNGATMDASQLTSLPSNSTATQAGNDVAAAAPGPNQPAQTGTAPQPTAAGSTHPGAGEPLHGSSGGFPRAGSSAGNLANNQAAAVPPAGDTPGAASNQQQPAGNDIDAAAVAAGAGNGSGETSGQADAGRDGAFHRESCGGALDTNSQQGSRKRAKHEHVPAAAAAAAAAAQQPGYNLQQQQQPQQQAGEQQHAGNQQQQPQMQLQMLDLSGQHHLSATDTQLALHLQAQQHHLMQQQQLAYAQQQPQQVLQLHQQQLMMQHQHQHAASLAAAAAAAQMAAAAAAAAGVSCGYGDTVVLQLSRIKGRAVLQADEVIIYRVEVTRNGLFEKYVFLPNDAIPLYGMRTWMHRDAIPQELLKMVENCLTTKAVPSEQYIEEIKAMKATLLHHCPHLARWGLGSNKVRLVTESGLRDLVQRLHRTMQKHGNATVPKTLEVNINWVTCPDAPQVPIQQWTAPVYSRRLQPGAAAAAAAAATAAEDQYAATAAAAAAAAAAGPPGYMLNAGGMSAAAAASGLLDDASASTAAMAAGMQLHPADLYQQQMLQQHQQMGLGSMTPEMAHMHLSGSMQAQQQQQQQHSNGLGALVGYSQQQQQHGYMQQQTQQPPQQQMQGPVQAATRSGSADPSQGASAPQQPQQHSLTVAFSQALAAPPPGTGLTTQGSRVSAVGDAQGGQRVVPAGPLATAGVAVPPAQQQPGSDPAALAAVPWQLMSSLPAQLRPKQPQQQAATVQVPTGTALAQEQQQQTAQDASPRVTEQQQQQAAGATQLVRSPGCAGSNGSTDSNMADAVAGLQALSRNASQTPCPTGQQQQHQESGGDAAGKDSCPVRDQQPHSGEQLGGGTCPPDASAAGPAGTAAAATPAAAAAAAATVEAIAVQQ